jgi:hypothetical protein
MDALNHPLLDSLIIVVIDYNILEVIHHIVEIDEGGLSHQGHGHIVKVLVQETIVIEEEVEATAILTLQTIVLWIDQGNQMSGKIRGDGHHPLHQEGGQ